MRNSRSPIRWLPFLVIACLLAFLTDSIAQTRPGGAGRGTTRTGGTNRGGFGGGGSSSISTGPRQYRSNTLLGDATIQIDPESRALVIVTDEETHAELDKVIKELDRPKPQVLIKVMFIEVTYNKGYDIGVEGSYTFNLASPRAAVTGTRTTTSDRTTTADNGTTTTVNSTTSQPLDVAASVGKSLGLESFYGLANETTGTFARLVTDDWSATLRLMATNGKLKVLSRPSIMARNNQEAVIVVGQEVPFITNSRVTDDGQTINTIQYDNVGIILRVTPFITSDGTVEMIVSPEISTLTDQTVPISNNASAPVIAKRSAETVVVTPHASTVVIGGLMETQKVEAVQKIPILGDIPYLGFPFRRKIANDVNRELLIFLTPYIINNQENVGVISDNEINHSPLINKTLRQDEIDTYLSIPSLFPTPKQKFEVEAAKRPVVIKTAAPPTSRNSRSINQHIAKIDSEIAQHEQAISKGDNKYGVFNLSGSRADRVSELRREKADLQSQLRGELVAHDVSDAASIPKARPVSQNKR